MTASKSQATQNDSARCGSMDWIYIADAEDAVIVRVVVGDPVPGVTDVGERAQIGSGAGPITEQVSLTVFPKAPFCGEIVMMSAPCVPGWTVKLVDAGLSMKSGVLIV